MILRGGSWLDTLRPVTASFRGAWSHLTQRHTTGFRICITPEDTMQVARDPVQHTQNDADVQDPGTSYKVVRGGSWICDHDTSYVLSSSHRSDPWATMTHLSLGFRICITPEDTMQVARDPVQQDGSIRVIRGGSWGNFGQHCRSAIRDGYTPAFRYFYLGFRVALTPSEPHLMTTSTDDTLTALTLGILESPADPLAWLALADYLEESGEDDRSTLVRSTLAMRQTLPGTPDHVHHQQTVQALIARGVRPCHPTTELDALPGARFAVIPPGGFLMGTQASPVVITQPFFLGVTPITQAQWQHVMGSNPARFRDQPDSSNRPVEMVSWNDCQEFCQKLQAMLPGWKVSLPTDAQWEYACRAGTQTTYYHGDDEVSLARYAHYNAQSTRAVGELLPNAFGLHDMLGNVWEWCQDGYRSDPLEGQETVEVSEEEWRVMRGGAWFSAGHVLEVQGSHKESVPSWDSFGRGLRLALDPQQEDGDSRVLRGGSVFNLAPNARSALRNLLQPSGRIYTGGLRITLDPTGPTLDPGKPAWGHIRGGSWVRVAGLMKNTQSVFPANSPPGPSLGLRVCVDPVQQDGSYRVLRGGSRYNDSGHLCRSVSRSRCTPMRPVDCLGFRVALEGVSA